MASEQVDPASAPGPGGSKSWLAHGWSLLQSRLSHGDPAPTMSAAKPVSFDPVPTSAATAAVNYSPAKERDGISF